MTFTTPRHATREVRARVWQALRQHLLPLLLAVALLCIPEIIAGTLDGAADAYLIRFRTSTEAYFEAFAEYEASPETRTEEQQASLLDAYSETIALEHTASSRRLAATLVRLAALLLLPLLLPGLHRVLLAILRGNVACWSDVRIRFREFRRAMGLNLYTLTLLFLCAMPGFLLQKACESFSISNAWVLAALMILGSLLTLALCGIAALRFQMAPWLLADGAAGAATELVALSADILDSRSLLPVLSILFPGLLMLAGAGLLHVFALQLLLPRALAGFLGVLLTIPGWAYLLTGSAAIFVTFRTE